MEQHSHPVLTIGATLIAGVATWTISAQDIDVYLAITLKIVSILSFLIGSAYALWKWRADVKMQRTVNEVMDDYQEKKQKAKQKEKK
jgi:hypothetical protein